MHILLLIAVKKNETWRKPRRYQTKKIVNEENSEDAIFIIQSLSGDIVITVILLNSIFSLTMVKRIIANYYVLMPQLQQQVKRKQLLDYALLLVLTKFFMSFEKVEWDAESFYLNIIFPLSPAWEKNLKWQMIS